MSMIDWYVVGFSALWIIGLSFVIAGLSLANYLGRRQNWGFAQALKIPACSVMIGLGLFFFCLGLEGGVSTIWEHLLWGFLALIFALQTWRSRKMSNP